MIAVESTNSRCSVTIGYILVSPCDLLQKEMPKPAPIMARATRAMARTPLRSDAVKELRDIMGLRLLEWISDGQMETESLCEFDIEIMVDTGVIWSMQPVTQISSKHHHSYIHTKSDSGAQSDISQKRLAL